MTGLDKLYKIVISKEVKRKDSLEDTSRSLKHVKNVQLNFQSEYTQFGNLQQEQLPQSTNMKQFQEDFRHKKYSPVENRTPYYNQFNMFNNHLESLETSDQ